MQAGNAGAFKKYAYAHVTDTKVAWKFEPDGAMKVTYTFTTKPYEGTETGTSPPSIRTSGSTPRRNSRSDEAHLQTQSGAP